VQQTPNTFIQLMAKEADIVILRGAPASGKSQTAKSLTRFFPKGVKIEVDILRQMVISVNWTNQKEHISLLRMSARLAHDFLKAHFKPVIVVDTFSGDKIQDFLAILDQLDNSLSIRIFGLYVAEDVLKQRLELRSKGDFKDFGISKKLNRDVLKFKHKTERQIATTRLSPTQTAEIIYRETASRP
jgi:hypothetical protein